ncbi:MAG: ribose-phosphate diphosphokinase [Candidatus Pacearchaeota archaeon]
MAVHKCSIIANPEGYGWYYAEKIHKKLISEGYEFELNPLHIKRFKDGEIKPKIDLNVRKRNCFFIHDSSIDPTEWFTQLVLINETLKNSAAQEIINVLPYLKFSRQDRKDESRVPISAKALADTIGLYANRVLTIDVHNPSIQGFYDIPFDNLYSFPTVVNYLKDFYPHILEDIVVMSTDAGGAPRAKSFAKKLGIKDIVTGYKSREKENEVEQLRVLGDVKGKNVLIVDDLIDTGNTLVSASNAVRELGAKKIYTYCTHGLFTSGVKKISDNFDIIFIGDTVNLKEPVPDNVKIISFIPLFAEAIYRISEGESLSQLFSQ